MYECVMSVCASVSDYIYVSVERYNGITIRPKCQLCISLLL